MPINYDGVYELRYNYFTSPSGLPVLGHRHTIDVRLALEPEVGQSFNDISTQAHNGTTPTLQTVTVAWGDLIRALYPATADFGTVELWKYPSEGYDAQFVSVYTLGAPGTGVGTMQPAQQFTMTLRSANGGIMRVQLMESVAGGEAVVSYPFPAGQGQNIANYLTGLTHPFVARDDSRPVGAIKYGTGQNEKLWRKRYRQ